MKSKMKMRLGVVALVSACSFALSGCHDSDDSGGPAAPAPPTTSDPTPPATGTVSVKISFPVGTATPESSVVAKNLARTKSLSRQVKSYVSPKSQSVSINVTAVNGAAPANAVGTVIDVKQGSNCALNGSSLDCTVSVAAPVGSDTFEVRTWPNTGAGGQIPISGGTATADVPANGSVTLAVNLLPYVASAIVDVTPGPGVLPLGSAGTFTVRVRGQDSAGDIITGADNYQTPITVTSKEIGVPGAHVTASPGLPVTFTSPANDTITLTYDGAGTASSYAFNVTGGAQPNYYITFETTTEHIYMSLRDTNEIDVFDINADGSLSGPSRVLKGSNTGLNDPQSLTVDTLGRLYVVNRNNNVVQFAPGASGNTAPIQTSFANARPYYVSKNAALFLNQVVDPNNSSNYLDMATVNYSNAVALPGSTTTEYAPFYVGSAQAITSWSQADGGGYICYSNLDSQASYMRVYCMNLPLSEIDGPSVSALDNPNFSIVNHNANPSVQCCLGGPVDVKFLPDGGLMVSSEQTYYAAAALTTYALPSGSTVAQLTGGNTLIANPGTADYDSNGNVYLVEHGFSTGAGMILQFAPKATGNVAPLHTLQGFTDIGGIAIGK